MNPSENNWSSNRIYTMVLLCEIIGISTTNTIPHVANAQGALGYIMCDVIAFIFFGVPLVYMELIIGQFTTRDCIDVWKARPCLSHTGYILVVWQILFLVYNHVIVSFLIHYLLISFENPIPYYICGEWRSKECNILASNFTVNQDCLKTTVPPEYCEYLHMTFPEYQYWRYYLLGLKNNNSLHIAWRVCLASGLVCIVIFLSCFRRKRSIEWVVGFLAIYPIFGYVILFIGSMLQKGIVMKYGDALDVDFKIFSSKFRPSHVMQQVVGTTGIGSGILFSLAAGTSFRTPCYANSLIIIALVVVFTSLTITTIALMGCPYAYTYGIRTSTITKIQVSLLFEKAPRVLYEFDYETAWLILLYSCNAVTALSTNIIFFFNLLEMVATRFTTMAKYPGLMTLGGLFCLFSVTIPLLGNGGMVVYSTAFRRFITLIPTFIAMIECLVFIIWYGLERFSEDVHFMQGIQPKKCLKVAWLLSTVGLAYVFFNELYYQKNISKETLSDILGWCLLLIMMGFIIFVIILKLMIAICRKKFLESIRLDRTWGPKSDLLQRSRAMFTAQAMTKEYMYRQYHLKAGIMDRQMRSNVKYQRNFNDPRLTSTYS